MKIVATLKQLLLSIEYTSTVFLSALFKEKEDDEGYDEEAEWEHYNAN